jgi:SAM-dependent methyltransferase
MVNEVASDAQRRLNSRPWDHDFIVMRGIAAAFREIVGRQIAPDQNSTVVDYGCGPMPYRPLFAERGAKYLGADLSSNQLADLHLTDTGTLPLDDSTADVVISSQVLEHVLDVNAYLTECRRVLNAKGTLLLSTHGSWIYHPHPTDVRRWTRWGLRFDIERCGFVVLEIIPVMGPLAYATQVQLLLFKGLLLKLGMAGRLLAAPISVLCQAIMWLQDSITPASIKADNAVVYVVAARRA